MDYMMLRKISEGYDINSVWARDKWLSEPTTLETIQLWEQMHNLDFDVDIYNQLCAIALKHDCAPEIYELIDKAHVKSFIFDKKELFLHKDIAVDYAQWLSPSFRGYTTLCLKNGVTLNFNSEEDFIVSDKALAEFTKRYALESYEYSIKANLCVKC
ncbi:MAG: KilA-N domain-containing protein [Coriobacteriia bacterium]|nr:KilA-N domain-containing protein [Coriobacteriia bacterium]